jgi:hypothetical protein
LSPIPAAVEAARMAVREAQDYDRDVIYAAAGGNFLDPDNGQSYSVKVFEEVIYFLNDFEFYWYDYNYDITSALNSAYDPYSQYAGPAYEAGYALKLYGYNGLGVNEYNHHSDWSQ